MPHPDELDELEGAPIRQVADRDDLPRRPWSRILLTLGIVGPVLWIGGADPRVVPVFTLLMLVLWQRLCRRSKEPLHVPWAASLGVLAAVATLLQWIPIEGMRSALAPGVQLRVEAALAGTGVEAWPGISVVPGETALQAASLAGLTVLFIASAQLSWRVAAAIVAGAGTAVALAGYFHAAAGTDEIYGLYAARDIERGGVPALLGTFVNPNHQSSLLLLGLFASGGLALDQHLLGLHTRDPSKVDRYGDRFLAAMAALTLQLPALVLSLSRGAIIAMLVLGPIATWMGLRRTAPKRRTQRRRFRRMSPLRTVILIGFVGLTLMVAKHGAWRELATLADVAMPGSSPQTKLRLAQDSMALLDQGGSLGVGRGAFVDLFGAVDSEPTHVLYTHVESMPAAILVEWGTLVGGVIAVGLVLWWLRAFIRVPKARDATARRIVLLGLLAMALQNAADFSLELLGVAAPAVALAGGLSPPPRWRWRVRPGRWVATAALVIATALAGWALPHTVAVREADNALVSSGDLEGPPLLRMRPLDGRLHGLLARRTARDGDWDEARAWAERATVLRPGAVDPWLILGAARNRESPTPLRIGRPGDDAMQRGLSLLHEEPSEELVDYLLGNYPAPQLLASIAPTDSLPWRLLVEALFERAPQHADAVAARRIEVDPEDPLPRHFQFELAMRAGRPALALHHARMWRAVDPRKAAPHVAVARALRDHPAPRLQEARRALEEALRQADLDSYAERGLVEEELVRTLLDLGDDAATEEARSLVKDLLSRPGSRDVQRRRERLVAPLR